MQYETIFRHGWWGHSFYTVEVLTEPKYNDQEKWEAIIQFNSLNLLTFCNLDNSVKDRRSSYSISDKLQRAGMF